MSILIYLLVGFFFFSLGGWWRLRERGRRSLKQMSTRLRILSKTTTDSQSMSHALLDLTRRLPEDSKGVREVKESLKEFINVFQKNTQIENERKVTMALLDHAAQVGHDLRSPLTAFEIIVSQLKDLSPDQERILKGALAKFRELANGLVTGSPKSGWPEVSVGNSVVGGPVSGGPVVLIDDDPLVRRSWQFKAEQRGVPLRTFSGSGDFNRAGELIDKAAHIFIDSNLGEKISGEQFAKELFDRGYANLYLATGYERKGKVREPWLKAVQDKTPPVWLFGL